MSYRVMIVDDEPLARERLKRFLEDDSQYDVVAEAGDGIAALDWLRAHQSGETADIVLLDIRMPGPDGVATAADIAALPQPPAVIFCTAYDEHALAAFRVNAVDYLLKPFRREDLHQALQRAVTRLQSIPEEQGRTHISARTHSGIRRVAVADILWFSADQKYVTAHYQGGEVLIDEPLKQLEEEFDGRFIRIHRSLLVATAAIDQLYTGLTGPVLTLHGSEEQLPVSRRHLASVRRFIKGG